MRGLVYSVSKRLILGASATVDVIFDPRAFTGNKLIFFPVVFKAFGAGPVFVDLYFGAEYTVGTGTEVLSINRDGEVSTPAQLKVYLAPTITNAGVKLPVEFAVYSNGIAATAVAGDESSIRAIFKANTSGAYMFRLVNQEAKAADALVGGNWVEV